MTNTQFFIISKIVKWCDDNLEKMEKEGKASKEIASACVEFIAKEKGSSGIHRNFISQYIDTCMA